MSSPIQGIPGHEPRDAPVSPAVQTASMLAVSGLLRVQRRWLLASTAAPQQESLRDDIEASHPDAPPPEPTEAAETGRSQRTVHLEDSEWSRLALGVTAEVLASIGLATSAVVLELEPDDVIVHLPTSEPPRWPFTRGRSPQSWRLPRDSRIIAALSVTPATMSASRKAALVTVSESHGRRALLDLVAAGSTILTGPWSDIGVKIADVAVELGTRRWSDLETLILVAFGPATSWLEGATHVPDLAAALDELTVRCLNGTTTSSICVIVPPWAAGPGDRLLGEVVRFAEVTAGVGALCCTSSFGARCRWELDSTSTGLPTLSFGNGRRRPMFVPAAYGFAADLPADTLAPPAPASSQLSPGTRRAGPCRARA